MAEGLAISRLELARLVVPAPSKNDPNRDVIVNQRITDLKRIIFKYPGLLREGRKTLNKVYDGILPLHYAVENQAPLVIIDLLAEAFKPAIFQEYTPTSFKTYFIQNAFETVLTRASEFVSSEIYCCLLRHSMTFLRNSGSRKAIESFFEDHGYKHEKAMGALLKTFPDFAAKRKILDEGLPLHYAGSRGAPEEVVAMLVEAHPLALTTLSGDGTTPLHMLLEGKFMRMGLVEHLTSPEAAKIRDAHDNLPIHSYCKRSYENEIFSDAVLEELVNMYPESVMQGDKNERMPLLCHLACTPSDDSNLPGIQYLVRSNPESIKLVDKYGRNALHYACSDREALSATVIHFLYESYPNNLITLDERGWSPLHYLCHKADNDDLPLFELMHEVTPQSFSLLTKDGASPLHIACHSSGDNNIGLVRFLAEACPLALKVISKGATPFHKACIRKTVQVQVIRFLAEKCPDLLEGGLEDSPFHETPLNVLCRNEHIADDDLRDCLRALAISKGAVEMRDRDRNSTLHSLCRIRASPECLQIVLDKSHDLVFARNANALTALHVAVESCASGQESNGIIKLLLDKYPLGIQDRDIDFKTPLVVACEKDVSLGVIYRLFHVDPISSLDIIRNAAMVIQTTSTGKRKREFTT